MSSPKTPCIGVCRLDPTAQFCTGCFRMIDELAEWGDASDRRRSEILAQLPARADAYRSDSKSRRPSTKVGA